MDYEILPLMMQENYLDSIKPIVVTLTNKKSFE